MKIGVNTTEESNTYVRYVARVGVQYVSDAWTGLKPRSVDAS